MKQVFRNSLLALTVAVLAAVSLPGCSPTATQAYLDQHDPAHAARTEKVTIQPGQPGNPSTQPITIVNNIPANPAAQSAEVVHQSATDPTIQQIGDTIPYGKEILSIIAASATAASAYFGVKATKRGTQLDGLQAASDTDNHVDAVAAAHAAIEAAPAAIAPYSDPQT